MSDTKVETMEDSLHIVVVGSVLGPDSKLLWDFLANADLSRVVSVANVHFGSGTPELILVVREDGSDLFDPVYCDFIEDLYQTKRPITRHRISHMMSVEQLREQAVRLQQVLANIGSDLHEGEAEEIIVALPAEIGEGGSE